MQKKKKINEGFDTFQEGRCWIHRVKQFEDTSTDLNEEP